MQCKESNMLALWLSALMQKPRTAGYCFQNHACSLLCNEIAFGVAKDKTNRIGKVMYKSISRHAKAG